MVKQQYTGSEQAGRLRWCRETELWYKGCCQKQGGTLHHDIRSPSIASPPWHARSHTHTRARSGGHGAGLVCFGEWGACWFSLEAHNWWGDFRGKA